MNLRIILTIKLTPDVRSELKNEKNKSLPHPTYFYVRGERQN